MGGDSQIPETLGFNKNAPTPKLDASKPSTEIRIRFHNGETTSIKVNLDTRTSAIYEYVMK